MPVQITSIEDGHISRMEITDPWRIPDFVATYDECVAMYDAGATAGHRVHQLVNLGATNRDPLGVLRVREHLGFTHPNVGYVVFCTNILLARRIAETAVTMIRFNRAKYFKTEADGLAFLREVIRQESQIASTSQHSQ